jgi:hypothetical protein
MGGGGAEEAAVPDESFSWIPLGGIAVVVGMSEVDMSEPVCLRSEYRDNGDGDNSVPEIPSVCSKGPTGLSGLAREVMASMEAWVVVCSTKASSES